MLEGSTYSYQVVAHGFNADSTPSNSVQLTMGTAVPAPVPAPATDPVPAPAAPANLSASALSSSRIGLQWTNKSSTQTVVAIERCAAPCSRFTEIARVAGTATSFTDSGLAARKSYSYRVRAQNAAGWSPYSASVTAKTLR